MRCDLRNEGQVTKQEASSVCVPPPTGSGGRESGPVFLTNVGVITRENWSEMAGTPTPVFVPLQARGLGVARAALVCGEALAVLRTAGLNPAGTRFLPGVFNLSNGRRDQRAIQESRVHSD